jgi:hypothetical protein
MNQIESLEVSQHEFTVAVDPFSGGSQPSCSIG